jgi:SsrA-binding protein
MTLVSNKKAFFDYEILKEFTAGILLSGQEVKSLRNGGGNLKGSYILVNAESECFLVGASIRQYGFSHDATYNDKKPRKLLLNRSEISKIEVAQKEARATIVPLKIITAGRLIKVVIALARGKKQYDKRESIKKRDLMRRGL